jgi:pimeloyl-ACP methyl ester carboxylesterase
MGKRIEQTVAILNGWLGDYLSRTQNGLASEMTFRLHGKPLPLTRPAFTSAYPNPHRRVVVLVHGLMNTEETWVMPDGHDYGRLLERDLSFTPAYIRYNTGLAIADNGAQLAALLETLVQTFPVDIEELLLVGYSMGGLVIRSATHCASLEGQRWLQRVRRIVYVGTPHLGAPAERMGKLVTEALHWIPSAYTQLLADLSNLRSSGVRDLGYADLRHEDRASKRSPWELRNAKHPVPLLPSIAHHLIAGSMFTDPRLALLFGDSVVPVVSATFGEQAANALIPPERVKVIPKLNHIVLAHHPEVYAALRAICEETS